MPYYLRSLAFVMVAFPVAFVHAQPPEPKPLSPKAPAEKLDGPPVVSAKAWAVADGKTGTVLWVRRRSRRSRSPAPRRS